MTRRCLRSPEARIVFLQQMLSFSSHPYLLLAAITLPFWTAALREAVAAAAPPAAPPTPSASPPPLPVGAPAGPADRGLAGKGDDGAGPALPPLTVPPEAAQALIQVFSGQVRRGNVQDDASFQPLHGAGS